MKKKELDGVFSFKMGVLGVGVLFLLSFVFGTTWVLRSMSEDDDQSTPPPTTKKTNPKKPLRVQIMAINTITLFFLMASIAEYRTNESISPFGVDPSKVPPSCKTQQQAYTSVVLVCSLMIVLYNYFVLTAVLMKPRSGNVITNQDITRIARRIHAKNAGFLVEVYPFQAEFVFFSIVAIFSVLMYGILVLSNYGVIETNLFRACVSPPNTDRFFDPFA